MVMICLIYVQHMNHTWCLKTIHFTSDHNIGKCKPIFKILSLTYFPGNSRYNYSRIFHYTLAVLLHYLLKLENYNCGRFQGCIVRETS